LNFFEKFDFFEKIEFFRKINFRRTPTKIVSRHVRIGRTGPPRVSPRRTVPRALLSLLNAYRLAGDSAVSAGDSARPTRIAFVPPRVSPRREFPRALLSDEIRRTSLVGTPGRPADRTDGERLSDFEIISKNSILPKNSIFFEKLDLFRKN
jgi:hypothetical protein